MQVFVRAQFQKSESFFVHVSKGEAIDREPLRTKELGLDESGRHDPLTTNGPQLTSAFLSLSFHTSQSPSFVRGP